LDIDGLSGFYSQNMGGKALERQSIRRSKSAQKKENAEDGEKSIGSIKCIGESLEDLSQGKGTPESTIINTLMKNGNLIKQTMTSMDELPAKKGEEEESRAINEKTIKDQEAERAKKWFHEVNTTNFYQTARRNFFPSRGSL
jgi:hypothetical protein